MVDSTLEFCNHPAHRSFIRKAEEERVILTKCYREPGHAGGHRYGVGYKISVDFVEERTRSKLQTISHADLKPGGTLTGEEIMALGQYFDLVGGHQ